MVLFDQSFYTRAMELDESVRSGLSGDPKPRMDGRNWKNIRSPSGTSQRSLCFPSGNGLESLLQRTLDYPLVNLGFSGNGQLEKDVISFLCEIDARLYILDCLPNLTREMEKEICFRTIEAVKQIRQERTAPILLCEHAGYSNADSNPTMRALYQQANRGSRKAFEALKGEGIQDIYYLSCEEIALPLDGWGDYVHLADRKGIRKMGTYLYHSQNPENTYMILEKYLRVFSKPLQCFSGMILRNAFFLQDSFPV